MAAERDFLIRSDECELSELASMIKKIVETTQDSEYPNFKLLPCVYDLGEEKNDKKEMQLIVFFYHNCYNMIAYAT